ncbi:uncharacterized protein LOC142979060 [Anticarsia gemmatalis]|uniref:uncharacterized protein LOC142979060 n=1 Tax=Anticarsia gemmatalis TaxID=129554 RepID=UPI003F76749E
MYALFIDPAPCTNGRDDGHHTNGTGFMVSKNLVSSVIRFDAISDRLCVLRIKTQFYNISIVNAYAPTELTDEDTKDEFYDHLESVYDQLPSFDAKILLGDFNAKVGREDVFKPTIGMFSKHSQSNDNGVRLISFATSKAMVIKSTMYRNKDIYKGTWKSPDGRTINQIDHALIDDRHKSTIQHVRTYRGADCDSDHYLLGIKLKTKIKVTPPVKHLMDNLEQINVENIQHKELRHQFQIEISNRFSDLQVENNVDDSWKIISSSVKDIALKVFGRKKRKKRKKWWSEDCEKVVEERRKYKLLSEQDLRWEENYREIKTRARRVIRGAKRDYLNNMVQDMETLIRANASRKFYQEVRTFKKGYQPRTQVMEDNNGNLTTSSEEIKTLWRNYFQTLLNCPPLESPLSRTIPDNLEEMEPLTFTEVREAIMRLKNNKAPGIDGIPAEVWKNGGGAIQTKIYELLLKIWEVEQQPGQWNVGVICPIHKKGCKRKCNNYRGIALLPTAYKVLSYVLLKRLEPYAEKILSDYQCGFRPNRSTIDQIFLLKQIMEKKWEFSQSLHSLFVDFTKAYDSIDREALYNILRNFNIPKKLVNLVEMATKESRMRVRVQNELTDEFTVVTGLKQGDALSPMLFNLVLEHVLRKVLALDAGAKLNGKHTVIGYADDLALLGESSSEVQESAKVLETEALKVGLRISHEKTEYLHMKRYKNTRVARNDLYVGDTTYKGVSKFKYLGCTITDTNTREEEIDIRVQNTLRCSAALHKVLVSGLLSRSTKIRIYKTVIRPILMYGCEAWTLTQKEENKLLVAERKVLRKILGPVQRPDGSWRIRKNAEIEELVANPNIIGEIKAHRLRWLGHVERMREDRSVKRAYLGRPTGRRPVGRPRYRWKDVVEADLRELQAEPKSDTTNTPIHTVSSEKPGLKTRSSSRKALEATSTLNTQDISLSQMNINLTSLITEIRFLREEVSDVKSLVNTISSELTAVTTRVDTLESRMTRNEEKTLSLEANQSNTNIDELKTTLNSLQELVHAQAQAALRNEVELIGINENVNENLTHIVQLTGAKVGVKLTHDDIDWVKRPGNRPDNNKKSHDGNLPRPVIVRFTRSAKRDEFLKSAKTRKDLISSDIEVQGPKRRLFINEHLTKFNRQLFRAARVCAKEANFKYCWIKHGNIYVRQLEGRAAITIRNLSDLEHYFNTPGASHPQGKPAFATLSPRRDDNHDSRPA